MPRFRFEGFRQRETLLADKIHGFPSQGIGKNRNGAQPDAASPTRPWHAPFGRLGGLPPVPGGQVGGGQGEIITHMARMMVNGTLRLGGRLIKTF